MNQQVAQFLQDGLAEVTRDVQLQLKGIHDDVKLMISAALPDPKGPGGAPKGDPEVAVIAGAKRKLPVAEPTIKPPDLGAAMAGTAVVAVQPASVCLAGSEDPDMVQ